MERFGGASERSDERGLWIRGVAAVAGLVVLVLFLIGLDRFVALYELNWGKESIERLFYEDLGFSRSWSAFIAVVGIFFYSLAWVPLSLWTYRVLAWRFSKGQLVTAFVCWVFVYGHAPFLHAVLGSNACFNQRTGLPQKWYTETPDGKIALFDSGGYDVVSGLRKRAVTSQVCTAFARQTTNSGARKITRDVREIEFFDAISGRPRVWYHRALDGSYELYDAPGFDPATSEALQPAMKDVVADILKRAPKNCFMFNGQRVCE